MKMKKRLIFYWATSLIAIFLAIIVGYQAYHLDGTVQFVDFNISVVSIVISFIAFIISVKTYLSIDSFYTITKMDGNVLENELYTTSIHKIISEYDQENSEEVSEALFDQLEKRFKKHSKNSCGICGSTTIFY
ncbi:hypothetical protein [Alkalibacillus almallahensis]|uniref:hypothetical protein n=1 Tax=Alkalibacillus almallahensis TaxID=1379154 RepID=UPI0014228470|nr:hypothetical protein [Alkalibacillus almallahensis]NIK11808.1 hypothetical protein [Alkalibacillus almallahensis]